MAQLEDPTPIFDPCSEDPRNFSRLARAQFGAWEVFHHHAFGALVSNSAPTVSNSAPAILHATPCILCLYQKVHQPGRHIARQAMRLVCIQHCTPPWGIGVKCRLKQMVRQPPLRQGLGVPAGPEIVEVT